MYHGIVDNETPGMKIFGAIIGTIIFCLYVVHMWVPQLTDHMTIAILDIGQGDAIYIRTPSGTDILVDGGLDRRVLSELGSVMPPYDHTIELVIATHPDADHIGGLAELPENYRMNTLVTNGVEKNTNVARSLDSWKSQGVHLLHAYRGWNMQIEKDVWLEFLHPNPPRFYEDANDDSVMFILHYKEFSMLFTGDASVAQEQELASAGLLEDIHILKVGHHGSRTSSSIELLEATTPETALISVGADNKFGHPHAGPLLRFTQNDIHVFRTDTDGRITCTTDGTAYACKKKRAGEE